MSLFRTLGRLRQTAPASEPEKTDPNVLMRFATLGTAVVTVTVTDSGGDRYYARCLGCDWTNYGDVSERCARDNANAHASDCRAMPKPGESS